MNETDPIKIGDTDWVPIRYNTLEENELFWLEARMDDFNSPMRKLDENTALHLRDGKPQEIVTTRLVYQKE